MLEGRKMHVAYELVEIILKHANVGTADSEPRDTLGLSPQPQEFGPIASVCVNKKQKNHTWSRDELETKILMPPGEKCLHDGADDIEAKTQDVFKDHNTLVILGWKKDAHFLEAH
jgi:hypothetical protein